MDKFTEIKEEILRRAKEANACVEQYKRALESQKLQELAQVIKDNFSWCCRNKVLDVEMIGEYKEEFASVGIYANENRNDGYVVINSEVDCLSGNAIAILCGNATVNEVFGNATVNEVCDNATVKYVFGNATVNEVCDNATVKYVCGNATVKYVCGNATVNKVFGNATVNKVCDNATVKYVCGNATVKYVCDNATVNKVFGNATVNKVFGNATVNEVCDNAYISVNSYIDCKISENAIMRVINENKIYTNTTVEKPKL